MPGSTFVLFVWAGCIAMTEKVTKALMHASRAVCEMAMDTAVATRLSTREKRGKNKHQQPFTPILAIVYE